MGDHLDVSDMNVAIRLNEVGAQNGREEFGWVDWVLLGNDIGSILHGVGCDDDTVVCCGISTVTLVHRSMPQGVVPLAMSQSRLPALHRLSFR